jgi:hypothetical protein
MGGWGSSSAEEQVYILDHLGRWVPPSFRLVRSPSSVWTGPYTRLRLYGNLLIFRLLTVCPLCCPNAVTDERVHSELHYQCSSARKMGGES